MNTALSIARWIIRRASRIVNPDFAHKYPQQANEPSRAASVDRRNMSKSLILLIWINSTIGPSAT
jgi:hypothetical protein